MKRLFSADQRAEPILAYLRSKEENVSKYISDAVVDETLPVYSQLRKEALYLLDYMADGAKEWHSSKLEDENMVSDPEICIREALGNGLSWLKKNHHIRKSKLLKDLMEYFHQTPQDGGVKIENTSTKSQNNAKLAIEELTRKNPDYHVQCTGLGRIAMDVLEHWENMWDLDVSYSIIQSAIYCEKLLKELDLFTAIKILQRMENEFILEMIE